MTYAGFITQRHVEIFSSNKNKKKTEYQIYHFCIGKRDGFFRRLERKSVILSASSEGDTV
jgi:hypothetical protein